MDHKLVVFLVTIFALALASEPRASELEAPKNVEFVCSIMGGSFDSSDPNQFVPLSQKKLEHALNALGAQLGVSVSSVAYPESRTEDLDFQINQLIRMYENTPLAYQANCLIIGLSISVLDDLDALANTAERAVRIAQNANIKVIAIDYPPAMDISAEWIDILSGGTLTAEQYAARSAEYRQRMQQLGVVSVDAWRGYARLPDDFHPTWQSSLRAAVRILAALL